MGSGAKIITIIYFLFFYFLCEHNLLNTVVLIVEINVYYYYYLYLNVMGRGAPQ